MEIRDGQTVTYIGPGMNGLAIGDQGKVLSAERDSCHVLWASGALHNQIVLVGNFDLAPIGRQATLDGLEDCLDVDSGISTSATRDIFDTGGEIGLLNQMAEEGHLASFAAIAEDAYEFIASRVRQDPAFRSITAHLDEDEGEALIRLASHVLLRDAFGIETE